jgi:hypothetical protein
MGYAVANPPYAFETLMIVILTSQEIAQYRSQLAADEEALIALDAIEDCEGDLEDAAISLAIQAGQQPDCSDWLDGLAKRCRVALCQEAVRQAISQGNLGEAVELFRQSCACPEILTAPVLIYVLKIGIEDFCEPLNLQMSSSTGQ